MDRERIQDFIQECRPYMIEQLQKEIVYYLYDKNVLTQEEFKKITKLNSRECQIILVLDILPAKPSFHLQCFIEYIHEWYRWIISRFQQRTEIQDCVQEEKQNMLDEGDVPTLPNRHVQRLDEYANLCKYLYDIKRNEYIVVHGMRGCGKSTLVVDVLRRSDTLALNTFKQKVFWLTVGRESSVNELTIQQELCSKLIFSRGFSMTTLPLDSQSAKLYLQRKLKDAELEDCLLILDDVSSSSIIQALDVGCKILVTTDDESVMNGTKKKKTFIKVSEGFTEDETLDLFSQCIQSNKLPNQAKHIHSICKGFPLTISLISSQLEEHKDDVLNNSDRWDVYVSKLKEKNISGAIGPYDHVKLEQIESLNKAIGLSIDSLNMDVKNLYHDFALFTDDVNIKAKVLCILWELEKKDVEDIMREFERKCLIVRAWNFSRHCYIYCVHDLLLSYLKEQISAQQKKLLHLKLIEKYQKRFGDNFNNFPVNDNYIFLYLGYHLKEANLWDQFPLVYLNLTFIGIKIMNFGAADLLMDLRKYREFIARDAESSKCYEDVVHFVKRVGACKSISNSDIIQFGLCESKDSYVYKMAVEMAKSYNYFELLTDISPTKSAPFVYYSHEEIVAATFASDENIIVANSSGTIKIINILQNHTLISFQGHEKKVTQLQLSPNYIHFLSASDDCTVRIWYLNDYSNLEKNFSEKPRTPSPQLRQSGWLDPWPKQRLSGEAAVTILDKHSLPIKHAQFSNKGTMIVSTSIDLKIILWRFVHKVEDRNLTLALNGFVIIELKELIENCSFSHDDELILCAAHKGFIFVYKSVDGTPISAVDIGYEIESMAVISGLTHISVFILSKHCFNVFDLPENLISDDVIKIEPRYLTEKHEEENFVYSTVSWDGTYVAIATKSQNILLCELSTGNITTKFTENTRKIRGLSWSKQNTALLTISGSELIKIWHLPKKGVPSWVTKMHPSIFDAAWIWDFDDEDSCGDRLLVTAAVDSNNNIHVFFDFKEVYVLSPPSNAEIMECRICPFDGNIIYACKNGNVYQVNIEDWSTQKIMDISCQKLLKLKIFSHGNKMLTIVLVETNFGKLSLIGNLMYGNRTMCNGHVIYECDSETISEFSADLKSNSVYVIEINHRLSVYTCRTAEKKFTELAEPKDCFDKLKFYDISSNFSHVATANDQFILIRPLIQNSHKIVRHFENDVVSVLKFNDDGTRLAVGFSDGLLKIFDLRGTKFISFPSKDLSNPFKFAPASVKDIVWAQNNSRMIVIYEREIMLYNITDQITLVSILFISVDKIICNQSFTKFVTIDSDGQFQVIKVPLS